MDKPKDLFLGESVTTKITGRIRWVRINEYCDHILEHEMIVLESGRTFFEEVPVVEKP